MMGLAEGEGPLGQGIVGLDLDGVLPLNGMTVAAVVTISKRVARLIENLFPNVDNIGSIHRVAPAQELVVADGRKGRAKEGRARHVPALVAMHLAFIPLTCPKERLMRVDEQQRMTRGALGRSYRPHVRTLGNKKVFELFCLVLSGSAAQYAYLGVLRFDNALDFFGPQTAAPVDKLVIKGIAIESQDMPRLKLGDEARLDLGIALEEVVQTIR